MSIMRCEKHDRPWDSDKLDMCPLCENEPAYGILSDEELRWLTNLRETEGRNSSTVALIENLIMKVYESAHSQPLVEAEAAAIEIVSQYPCGDNAAEEEASVKDIAAIIRKYMK